MRKFSKISNRKSDSHDKEVNNVLYNSEYGKIISFEDWTVFEDRDIVVCIPYLIEENKVVLRHEYIPTYKYLDGQEYHINIVGGGIENGESPEKALLRELEEEAGIVLRDDYQIEMLKPLFISKGHANKYYPCILTLNERDYHEVIAKGDGSDVEKKSQAVKVDIKFLNKINASDLITEYMLLLLKQHLNIS